MICTVLLTQKESEQLTVSVFARGSEGVVMVGRWPRLARPCHVQGSSRLFPLQDLHLIHLPLASLEPFLGHHYLSSDISDIVVCHQPVCILMYLYSLPTLVFRDT